MSIKKYKNTDSTQLSAHFNVREFRCKDGGTHDILISSELIDKLEQLHVAFHCSKIIVTSGYRCPTHDKAVGGNGSGQHTKGTAADICCYAQDGSIISSKLVCCAAQDIGFTGIANIDSSYQYTHVDVRTGYPWYGDEVYGTSTITNDFYSYYGVSKQNNSVSNTKKIVTKGVDVSYAQGKIDWKKVKESGNVDFAILRAGYGREYNQIDEQFERNYSECKRLQIPIGVYWYSYATTADEAKREAQVCLDTIQGKQFEYPVAFDIEEKDSLQNADALCKAFCDAIESAGYYAAIYTFKSALEHNMSDSVKSKYDIFLSHIGVSQTNYTGSYGLWQYSWTGDISGINGDVDLDYAYKDYPAIVKASGLNGFSGQNSNIENEESDKSDTDNIDTLKQILKHVESIDNKL